MTRALAALAACALLATGCTRVLWRVRSPDHTHLAEVIEKDHKQRVRLDGHDSPPHPGVGLELVLFSPDGAHLAYPAFDGQHWTIIHDGKPGPAWDGIGDCAFSPDGTRLACAVERDHRWHVAEGDRASPPAAAILRRTILFSPDSQHLAFIAERDGKRFAVRDGVEEPPWDSVTALRFSDDGQHLAYLAERGRETRLILDGAASAPYEAIAEYALAPAARRVALLGRKDRRWHVIVDGVPGPAWDSAAALTFSPDGAHLACMVREPGGERVLLDDQPGPLFPGVDWRTLHFSPDGSHLAYTAETKDGAVNVVDGTPGPRFDVAGPVQFAPRNSWAYAGRRRDTGTTIILDGRPLAAWPWADDPVFAPDGGLGFIAGRGRRGLVVVRGREIDLEVVMAGTLVFSADGAHFAVLAGDAESHRFYLAVDGTRRRPFDMSEIASALARLSFDASLAPATQRDVLRRAVAAELAREVAVIDAAAREKRR